MDVYAWIPSITTTSALAIVLWLGRNVIKTRLLKSVEHEFNTKLEAIRSEFRQQEEVLKADLRSKETDIAALRSGAMNAMASRQMSLDKHRLEAVDQLWSSVTALAPAKSIASLMFALKFEEVAEEAARNREFREFFEKIGAGCDSKKFDLSGAAKAKPFVSPMAWAVFSAFHAIVMQAEIKLVEIKSGIGPKDFSNKEAVAKLVKAALTHRSDFIDKHGDSAYYYLLDELEGQILDEFRKMLTGEEADKASLEKAAEIVKLSNQLSESDRQSTMPPNSALQGTPAGGRP